MRISNFSRMDKVLTDSVTGQQYMLHPGSEELQEGIVEYVPTLHAHLWSYVTVDGQVFTNDQELIDWDTNVDEWKEDVIGQWPFGNPPSENQRITQEVLDCLDYLASYLEYEEWVMEQIEAQDAENDDDDDDDEEEDEREDEGYNSDDEGVDENDIDDWIFGLVPMLRNIHL